MTWDESKLTELIDNRVEENTSLEYKASAALGPEDKKKAEITKDVSALANAAGGTIIYGMKEFSDEPRKHLPEKIDPVDRRGFSKEWLDQVIHTIQPRPKVVIHPVELSSAPNDVAYVVEVPQSSTAHQARDLRYYKRLNFIVMPMEDYEIRDTMRRRKHPIIETRIQLELRRAPYMSKVIWTVENTSDILARDVCSVLSVPANIGGAQVEFEQATLSTDEQGFIWWRLRVVNGFKPLFPGSDFTANLPFKFLGNRTSHLAAQNEDPRFSDVLKFKTYADEMPFIEGQFPVADISRTPS